MDMQIVLGGRRTLHGKSNVQESFNAYVGDENSGLGFLVTGLRISKGRLLAPVKWNPTTKKYFNTSYLSKLVAESIVRKVKSDWPDLELGDVENAAEPAIYTPHRFAQLLQHSALVVEDEEVMA